MDVAREQENRLAFTRQRIYLFLREAAWIGQLARNLFIFCFIAQVFFAGDDRHNHLFAERGLSQSLNFHAV